MTESSKHRHAHVRQSKTLASTVWIIPLIAAIAGIWLLVDYSRQQGPEITLLMDNAEGIEVNTTTIRLLNVEIGRVSSIRLRPDHKGVEVVAKLQPSARCFRVRTFRSRPAAARKKPARSPYPSCRPFRPWGSTACA